MARNFRLYYGDEAQLPLSDYDGDHGVGNEPAYRGVLLAFFTQFNTTAAGGRIPSFRFLVQARMARLAFPDFTLGTYSPESTLITVVPDYVQNIPSTSAGNEDIWKYPVPADAYGLTANFTVIQAGGGDPITVGLSDASNNHIIDFQPITED